MELKKMDGEMYYFSSGSVNVGYVHQGEYGLLIDAGLDSGVMKKIVRKLAEHELPLSHLFITHAHADHYGGANYLQKTKQVVTYAPLLEEAMLKYPVLEPIYLFQGNNPLQELRNKFLEGPSVHIDVICEAGPIKIGPFEGQLHDLSGHSHHMLGLEIHDILFAGDSYFSYETLQKHKIPFIIDAGQTLQSLEKLFSLPVKGALPGHGIYEEAFQETVKKNIQFHQQIIQDLEMYITRNGKVTTETLMSEFTASKGIEIHQITSWVLFRTALFAYLNLLLETKRITYSFEKNTLVIKSNA